MKYREEKRLAKPGERIKLVYNPGYTFSEPGQILTVGEVDGRNTFIRNCDWCSDRTWELDHMIPISETCYVVLVPKYEVGDLVRVKEHPDKKEAKTGTFSWVGAMDITVGGVYMVKNIDPIDESYLLETSSVTGYPFHSFWYAPEWIEPVEEPIIPNQIEPVEESDEAATDTNVATIQDSGDRTEFPTGAVRDIKVDKGRFDLMPLDTVAKCLARDKFLEEFGVIYDLIDDFKASGETRFLYDAILHFTEMDDSTTADALLDLSKHFEQGAKKYGVDNWQKGIPVHSYIDSACRHLAKVMRGDTDEPHDRAFVWNLLCCAWTMDNRPGMDDYTIKKGKDNG